MSAARFLVSLCIALALVAASQYVFQQYGDTAPYTDIGWWATGIFSLLSIGVFTLTTLISDTKKKVLFLQLILMNMLIKLVFSGLIVFIYYKECSPADGVFVLPFIVVYVIFTAFETYFMNEQAKAK